MVSKQTHYKYSSSDEDIVPRPGARLPIVVPPKPPASTKVCAVVISYHYMLNVQYVCYIVIAVSVNAYRHSICSAAVASSLVQIRPISAVSSMYCM
jgi:hypothetical protein